MASNDGQRVSQSNQKISGRCEMLPGPPRAFSIYAAWTNWFVEAGLGSEPGVFDSLEREPLEEKNQVPEPLGKSQEPAPKPQKN